VNLLSESESDPFARVSPASAHRSDEQDITDEGHEADDETNAYSGRHEQQTDLDTRADPIELKEIKRRMDGPSKVDTVCFFLCTHLIISQGDDLCIS
jgi:hypothetical protein